MFFSFQLKNTGDVEFNYNWNIEAGWTREPTVVSQPQPDEKVTITPAAIAPVKSAKGSRDASKSARQTTPAHSKGASDSRQTSRVTPSPADQSKQTSVQIDARPGSRIASAIDGRPATAMALAYEAGSVFDEPQGNDILPFSIEPANGVIKAKEEATFTVRFSPLDTRQYGGTLVAE